MNDWRVLAIALAFVAWMGSRKEYNHRALRFAGLLVLALAGYKTVPMLVAGLNPSLFDPVPEVTPDGGLKADIESYEPSANLDGGDLSTIVRRVATSGARTDVCFTSEWDYAVGDSSGAVTDNGKWNGTLLNGAENILVEAATASHIGFPTTNGLRARINSSLAAGLVRADSVCTVPAVGASIYYRAHLVVDAADSIPGPQDTHPFEIAAAGTLPWRMDIITREDSTGWHQEWTTKAGTGGQDIYDLLAQDNHVLPKDTTIRFELEYHRVEADSGFALARTYVWNDGSGSWDLRYESDDYVVRGGAYTMNDSTPEQTAAPEMLASPEIGINGWDIDPGYVAPMWLWGAVAICTDDWCGAYPIAGVEGG